MTTLPSAEAPPIPPRSRPVAAAGGRADGRTDSAARRAALVHSSGCPAALRAATMEARRLSGGF